MIHVKHELRIINYKYYSQIFPSQFICKQVKASLLTEFKIAWSCYLNKSSIQQIVGLEEESWEIFFWLIAIIIVTRLPRATPKTKTRNLYLKGCKPF